MPSQSSPGRLTVDRMMLYGPTFLRRCRTVFGLEAYLIAVAANYSDVVVEDDQVSTVLDDTMDLLTKLSGDANGTVTYFEGLNILIRIPGTRQITGAILLSAHFDSVSTARGATVCPMCLLC
jgi:hypothetical protein